MSPRKKAPTMHTEQRTEQRNTSSFAPLPPLAVGVYAAECVICGARPGEWCRAVLTLPTGTFLSHAHDRRIGEASKRRYI
jgi:hypothetical protein